MTESFGEFSQAWTRAFVLLLILVPFGLATGKFKNIPKVDRKWFIIIGLCGGLNQAPYFFGFEHLNVGTATLIFYTMLTIGAYIYGKTLFDEKLGAPKIISLILSILGLAIIYPIVITTPIELVAALATSAAGMMGALVVLTKKLSGEYSETQILTTIFIFMLIINFAVSTISGNPVPSFSNHSAWLGQLGYILTMLAANSFVIAGFKHIEPSVGGIIGLFEVVFAIIIGLLLLSETISLGMILGVGLILFAMSMPLVKQYRTRSE